MTDIKANPDMVDFFVVNTVKLIRQIIGYTLSKGDWIVTSPSSTKSLCSAKNRRHKTRSLISANIAEKLAIPFYKGLAECHSKHRIGAVFTFGTQTPKESNIIVFDDIVTTGLTMISMRNLLQPLGL